ncbi:MAG: hypothetical protein HUU06_03125 [Planctomycetaceae bacterium]|nr:hypothetical protein [Planctomycetota bacterium]NUN51766.1 hypothetical protein [Planctomycetaceae bacterium]
MRTGTLFASALAAGLLLAAARSDAIVTDNTDWACSTRETLKVSGAPAARDEYSGIELSFDGEGNFSLYLPEEDTFYGGTVTAKGKTGFLGTPDASSVEDLRVYVEEQIQFLTGAESVDVATFTWSIKGKVKNDELKAVLKAKGKGSIVLGGRTRKGAGKLTEALVGSPAV